MWSAPGLGAEMSSAAERTARREQTEPPVQRQRAERPIQEPTRPPAPAVIPPVRETAPAPREDPFRPAVSPSANPGHSANPGISVHPGTSAHPGAPADPEPSARLEPSDDPAAGRTFEVGHTPPRGTIVAPLGMSARSATPDLVAGLPIDPLAGTGSANRPRREMPQLLRRDRSARQPARDDDSGPTPGFTTDPTFSVFPERTGQDSIPDEPVRGGRDVPAAVGVGAGLFALVVVSLIFRKEGFVIVASLAVLLAVWEIASVLLIRDLMVPVIPLAVGSLGMMVSAFVAGDEGLVVAFLLTAFGVLLWRVLDGLDGAARDIVAGVFTAAYVPFLAAFTMLMLGQGDGSRRVIVFILVTVASDVGGYAAGSTLGRHPMAPTVSPKKSWEGFAGSITACVMAGVAGVVLLLHGVWWAGVVVGVAAALAATLGDLAESLLKRDLGVKDMGTLLPGHGGMMDRLDSLLISAPAVYLLLYVLVAVH